MKQVILYTDGGCTKNPGGIGAYAAILIYKNKEKILTESFRSTTSNRMELLAVVSALKALKEPCEVTLYSDSDYVIGMIKRKSYINLREKAKNKDLWIEYKAVSKDHKIIPIWVRGHSGVEHNERCDYFATKQMAQKIHNVDIGYENREVQKNITFS